MKKTLTIAAAALFAGSLMSTASVFAEDGSIKVNVTIADDNGNLVLVQENVEVTDIDNDGALTVNDALYAAHEAKFEGGAEAGYRTGTGQYGLLIEKLWGIEKGINYSFYVDNQYAGGLTDAVKDGGYVNAFVFRDTNTFADKYSYFDTYSENVNAGDEKELTLYRVVFDENYNPVPETVEGAKITINGETTDLVTDAEGKVKVKVENAGKNVISALYDVSDTVKIVPPAAVLNVEGEAVVTTEPETEAAETTTVEATTTTTTTVTTTTTKAATTTKNTSKSGSPKTGDAGTGAAFAMIGVSVVCAFALRRRNED